MVVYRPGLARWYQLSISFLGNCRIRISKKPHHVVVGVLKFDDIGIISRTRAGQSLHDAYDSILNFLRTMISLSLPMRLLLWGDDHFWYDGTCQKLFDDQILHRPHKGSASAQPSGTSSLMVNVLERSIRPFTMLEPPYYSHQQLRETTEAWSNVSSNFPKMLGFFAHFILILKQILCLARTFSQINMYWVPIVFSWQQVEMRVLRGRCYPPGCKAAFLNTIFLIPFTS